MNFTGVRARAMVSVFTLALFVGSFLVFSIQPMIGKVLLPYLGGSAFVWNTCLVFFQVMLLVGYFYAHLLSTRFSVRMQWVVHCALLVGAVIALPPTLPVSLAASAAVKDQPLIWLVAALFVSCGLPYFLLSATSPLLQTWYYKCFGEDSHPYYLFAASNAGSILALMAYPFAVEPHFILTSQASYWAWGFGFVLVLMGVLGWAVFPLNARVVKDVVVEDDADGDLWEDDAERLAEWERQEQLAFWGRLKKYFYWMALAFVPSSLLVAVTTHLTTDVAAIPMLWIVPLLLYLLTFVLTFLHYSERLDRWMVKVSGPLVLVLLFITFAGFQERVWLVMLGHLSIFFLLSLACHGRLVLVKPAPERLTHFYLCLAGGGALGGAFNSLLAPQLFNQIAEYSLAAVGAIFLLRAGQGAGEPWRELWRRRSTWVHAGMVVLVPAVALGLYHSYMLEWFKPLLAYWDLENLTIEAELFFFAVALPCLFAFFVLTSNRFVAMGALLLTCTLLHQEWGENTVYRKRGYYGLLTVREFSAPVSIALVHGGILHGEQWTESETERLLPRSYYHRDGPLGQIIDAVEASVERPTLGVIGLGTGAISSYGHRDNSITYFEIDPRVIELAKEPRYFSYVDDCKRRGCRVNFVLGDGRLGVRDSEETFDLIVVDAFSSDAIPIHLLTKEAIETYFGQMPEHGMVAFHVSNRYLDLPPVLFNMAEKYDLAFAMSTAEDSVASGLGASTWVVLANDNSIFGLLTEGDDRWTGVEPRPEWGVWTDDYANVFAAFTWM